MRWKFLVPFLVVLALVGLLLAALIDPLVRFTLEDLGTAAVGARVEIRRVETDLLDLHVTLRDLQVADPNDPWLNLFEAQRVSFDLAFLPLLSRRAVIDDMRVEGLLTGQRREHWGGLGPGGRFRPLKEKARGIAGAVKLPETVDLAELTDPSQLTVVKEARATRERLDAAKREWQQRLERFRELEIPAETDKEALRDPAKAMATIKKLKALRDELYALKADIDRDVAELRRATADLAEIREQDLDDLMRRLGVDPESLGLGAARSLFGESAERWLRSVLSWLKKGRTYLTRREVDAGAHPPERLRLRGQDIVFPITNARPRFVVRTLHVTANQDGSGLEGGGAHLTLQPYLMDAPTMLELAGRLPGGTWAELSAKLDYRSERPAESLRASVQSLDLKAWAAARPTPLPLELNAGKGSAKLHLTVKGESLGGDLSVNLAGAEFKPSAHQTAVGGIDAGQLGKALSGLGDIEVEGRVGGTLDEPVLALESNLDEVLGGQLRGELRAQTQRLRNQLDAQLKELVGPDVDTLRRQITAEDRAVKEVIAQHRDTIDELLARQVPLVDDDKIEGPLKERLKKLF